MKPHYLFSAGVSALFITGLGLSYAGPTSTQASALRAVTNRIQAFNNHDLENYLSAHHENVQIYEFPDKPVGAGRSHLKRIFGPLLERNVGSIEVKHQVTIDNRVVSEELQSYGATPGETVVVIYTVDDNLISSIYLVEPED